MLTRSFSDTSETIAGGSGAGPGWNGTSGVHGERSRPDASLKSSLADSPLAFPLSSHDQHCELGRFSSRGHRDADPLSPRSVSPTLKVSRALSFFVLRSSPFFYSRLKLTFVLFYLAQFSSAAIPSSFTNLASGREAEGRGSSREATE